MHTLEQSALNTNSMEQQISGRCRKECNSGDIPESQGVTELCFQMATARTSHKILVSVIPARRMCILWTVTGISVSSIITIFN